MKKIVAFLILLAICALFLSACSGSTSKIDPLGLANVLNESSEATSKKINGLEDGISGTGGPTLEIDLTYYDQPSHAMLVIKDNAIASGAYISTFSNNPETLATGSKTVIDIIQAATEKYGNPTVSTVATSEIESLVTQGKFDVRYVWENNDIEINIHFYLVNSSDEFAQSTVWFAPLPE